MARLDDRGGRDAAGKGPYHRPDSELAALRDLGDWSLGDGEPDIRGWEVQTVGGRAIGHVRDLLVDRAAGEVVLLDIDLDGTDARGRAPIRAVQIDRAARVVRMDSADLMTGDVSPDHRAAADIPRGALTPDARPLADRPLAGDSAADRDYPDDDATRRTTERLADGTIEETVVERRPVVYEEVVVRRRVVDPDAPVDPQRGQTRAD